MELVDRAIEVSLDREGLAEIIVGSGELRFGFHRLLKMGNGLIDTTTLEKGISEVVMGVGIGRVQAQSGLELGHCLGHSPQIEQGRSEIIMDYFIIISDGPFFAA